MREDQNWWKSAVLYQIYPKSFLDTDGDGIGDLQGIIAKADYLKELGVDGVWLSPIYASPGVDNGYDVSDYQEIDPQYGTLEDFDQLVEALHSRGIKIIMDLVVNHTSDQHPWFLESKSSLENPKRDWYIWRDGKADGQPPCNWGSFFGGSVWDKTPETDQYYFHLFAPQQPDLNWENPEVRQAVAGICRWWINRGVDGFRLDAIHSLDKDRSFPDHPDAAPGQYPLSPEFHINRPMTHVWLRELNQRVLGEVMTVGELNAGGPEVGLEYAAPEREELNLVFQFEIADLSKRPNWEGVPYDPAEVKRLILRWQRGFEGRAWNCNFFENHDLYRSVSEMGDDGLYWRESATMLATVLLTLRGTPFLYQGEELGMTNCPFALEEYDDLGVKRQLNSPEAKRRSREELEAKIGRFARDNARTPMQWDGSPNAGFTTGTPWLKLNPNYTEINVQREERDGSVLDWYKKLIRLRKASKALSLGGFRPLLEEHTRILAYLRQAEGEEILVLANLTGYAAEYQLDIQPGALLMANYSDPEAYPNVLRPYEVKLYRQKERKGTDL